MKIQLVKAPTQNTGMPEHDWYTPLNLIWLANYLCQYDYEVEILDGQILTIEEILSRISADLVGVSFDILSIDKFDQIVYQAKSRGCFTLAGGHLATALGERLLIDNPNLDAVACYDGEEALLGVVRTVEKKKKLSKEIPNLIFRQNGTIVKTIVRDVNLSDIPLPKRDVGGIQLDDYIKNFQETKKRLGFDFNYNRPTNTYSHKGCLFRTNGNGCSFCSRVDQKFRLKPAKRVYEEYKYLERTFDIDYISDFSDSWIYTPFVRDLVEQYERKGKLSASIRVYGDVRMVTADNARMMRQIGVNTVLLGIESGNEDVLKKNGKPTTRKQILAAVDILAANDMKIADAYVLGLIGETRESVNDTISLAKEIRERCKTEISYWNLMTPLPGSRIWNILVHEKYDLYPDGVFHIDTEYLERVSIKKFTQLGIHGYEYLVDRREEMLSLSRIASSEFVTANR